MPARFLDHEEGSRGRVPRPRPSSVSVTRDEPQEGASAMKKILLLIAAVVGALAIQKKFKDQQAEQDLWAEATDKV